MFILKATEKPSDKKDEEASRTAQRMRDALEAAEILYQSNDFVEIYDHNTLIYSMKHDPQNPKQPIIENNIPNELQIPSLLKDQKEETSYLGDEIWEGPKC